MYRVKVVPHFYLTLLFGVTLWELLYVLFFLKQIEHDRSSIRLPTGNVRWQNLGLF